VLAAHYRARRAEATGSADDAVAAAKTLTVLVAATPDDDPELGQLQGFLISARLTAHELLGSVESQVALAEALLTAIGDPDVAELARHYWYVDPDIGDPTPEQQLTLARLGVLAFPPGDRQRFAPLLQLGMWLADRAATTGTSDDTAAAVSATLEAVTIADASPLDIGTNGLVLGLIMLGRRLLQRHEIALEPDALPEALVVARRACSLAEGTQLDEARVLLGTALITRYNVDGRAAELGEAIDVLHTVAEDAGSEATAALSLRGIALSHQYRRDGDPAIPDEAVRVARAAVELATDDPALPDWLANLSITLGRRHRDFGDPQDARESAAFAARAVALTPPGHADRARLLHALSWAQTRERRSENAANLDEAVALARESISAAPGRGYDAGAFTALGDSLMQRFELSGRVADLDEAVGAVRSAIDAPGTGAAARLDLWDLLGLALHERAVLVGSLRDAEDSVAATRAAIGADGPDAARLDWRSHLGLRLTTRHQMTGRREDIDEAVATLRAVVSATTPGRAPGARLNLANALSARYQGLGDSVDLDEGIAALREATGAPSSGRYRTALGLMLTLRAENGGGRADADEAVELLRVRCSTSCPRPPPRPWNRPSPRPARSTSAGTGSATSARSRRRCTRPPRRRRPRTATAETSTTARSCGACVRERSRSGAESHTTSTVSGAPGATGPGTARPGAGLAGDAGLPTRPAAPDGLIQFFEHGVVTVRDGTAELWLRPVRKEHS
jgi:tetratricopeptide (TPR) repeat protein